MAPYPDDLEACFASIRRIMARVVQSRSGVYLDDIDACLAAIRVEVDRTLAARGQTYVGLGQEIAMGRNSIARFMAGSDDVSVRTLRRLRAWYLAPPAG